MQRFIRIHQIRTRPSDGRMNPIGKNIKVTYHVNELSNGKTKPHKNSIGYIGHGTGPLVVPQEKLLQQSLLGMGTGLDVTQS